MQGSKNTFPMRRWWLTDFDANKKWQISTNICLFIGKSCHWISEERKTHNGQKWCHRRLEWFASGLTCLSLRGPRRLQTKWKVSAWFVSRENRSRPSHETREWLFYCRVERDGYSTCADCKLAGTTAFLSEPQRYANSCCASPVT